MNSSVAVTIEEHSVFGHASDVAAKKPRASGKEGRGAAPAKDNTVLYIRADADLIAALDALASRIQAKDPLGREVSRQELVVGTLRKALALGDEFFTTAPPARR